MYPERSRCVADQLAGTVHVMRASDVHARAHVSQRSRLRRTWLFPAIFWSSVPTNVVERGRRHLCPNRDDYTRCKFAYDLRSSPQRRTHLCRPGQWLCILVWRRWTPSGLVGSASCIRLDPDPARGVHVHVHVRRRARLISRTAPCMRAPEGRGILHVATVPTKCPSHGERSGTSHRHT